MDVRACNSPRTVDCSPTHDRPTSHAADTVSATYFFSLGTETRGTFPGFFPIFCVSDDVPLSLAVAGLGSATMASHLNVLNKQARA